MITLRLNEEQAKICAQACEFFARIRMGQFQELVWLCGKNHCAEDYDTAQRAWLDLRKQVYPDLDGPGHSYGVGYFPEADTAYDIHQVIDFAMGGKEPWSHNPLPECYNNQKPKPLTLEELLAVNDEPVWIWFIDSPARWVIRHSIGWIDTTCPERMSMFNMKWYKHSAYGVDWVAYRHKPEEENL